MRIAAFIGMLGVCVVPVPSCSLVGHCQRRPSQTSQRQPHVLVVGHSQRPGWLLLVVVRWALSLVKKIDRHVLAHNHCLSCGSPLQSTGRIRRPFSFIHPLMPVLRHAQRFMPAIAQRNSSWLIKSNKWLT